METNIFLSKADQSLIVKSIESAELNTSGEIRVHIESSCKADPVDRAVYIFNRLKMYETKDRNGVLIYIAYKSRKLSIIGDSGINSKVPADFWDEIKEKLLASFVSGDIVSGLTTAIQMSGEKLKEYFPYTKDDINEQSNEISFGK
ncbi:MAG: TPM domain-containing protein [Rikenellaceae bacterium]